MIYELIRYKLKHFLNSSLKNRNNYDLKPFLIKQIK